MLTKDKLLKNGFKLIEFKNQGENFITKRINNMQYVGFIFEYLTQEKIQEDACFILESNEKMDYFQFLFLSNEDNAILCHEVMEYEFFEEIYYLITDWED